MKKYISLFLTLFLVLGLLIGCSVSSEIKETPSAEKKASAVSQTDSIAEKESPVSDNDKKAAEPVMDYSGVQTEWNLQDGYFVAGTDIPAGTFDVFATGGIGFISSYEDSANLRGPGYEDFNDYYPTYKNFRMGKDDILEIKGVQIKIVYSKVLSDISGRVYDEESAIEMTPGNYIVGEDIAAGTYCIRFVSGDGGFISSDRDDGERIVSSNMDGDPKTGEYVDFVSNILLVEGESFQVTSGVVALFIPEKVF